MNWVETYIAGEAVEFKFEQFSNSILVTFHYADRIWERPLLNIELAKDGMSVAKIVDEEEKWSATHSSRDFLIARAMIQYIKHIEDWINANE